MPIAYGMAAGMGSIRTAGDLVMVMRIQLNRKMRLAEAKQYVAEKLKARRSKRLRAASTTSLHHKQRGKARMDYVPS